jgi:hypothetical protein
MILYKLGGGKMRTVVLFILCASAALPALADVSFLGEWADFGPQFQKLGSYTRLLNGVPVEWVAGQGANHWHVVQEKGDDRLQAVLDPTSPKGGAVLRVEVRPGDNVGYTGERAEVSHMLDTKGSEYPVTVASGHEVYGIAIKLDPHWEPPLNYQHLEYRWGIFLQLHSPDDFESSPAFSLSVQNRFYASTCAGDVADKQQPSGNKNVTNLEFSRGDLRQGHWIQFLIDVVWAYDNHGSLKVSRRDEGDVDFVQVLSQMGVPTLQYKSTLPSPKGAHYWKAGYYRTISPAAISRLWLGPVVRGTSSDEVAKAAFGRP